ncbi:DUF6541 family protein [Microbacterium invictum]|uniref:DUF6541 family protein n=1 Tax=Microbacterium invictum TaxID=515415 RepID=A0ABZ0VGW9_9MICO|nr:DUF6541 family protein [Microbacterium invictum]WQB72062.1 DUF6541 family protein [Microbacterium invictum]
MGMLLLPGLIGLAPLRGGMVPRVALAGPLSVLLIGIAGVIGSVVGLPFMAWHPFILAAVVAIGVLLFRRSGGPPPSRTRRRTALVLTWLAASALIAAVAFAGTPSPALVSQSYDNVFHVSAIARILVDGDASSLTLRTLIETDREFAYYPAAWHSTVASVAQLTGQAIPIAVNATWIAVAAAVWLPGVAWISHACLPRINVSTAALVALPLGAAFGSMPYALLTWGTLYPTFLATALLPAAVAVPVIGWRLGRANRPGARRAPLAWTVLGTAATLAAVAFSQPRVLASWALIMSVPTIFVAVGMARRGLRGSGAARRRAIVALALSTAASVGAATVAAWYVIARLGLFERPLEERLGGPQAAAVQNIGTGVWQVVSQSTLTGVGAISTAPSVLLAIVVIAGAVVAWRARRSRWLVISFGLLALLYILAAGSDDVFSKLSTAVWYKDKFRLSSVMPVLGVPLAVLGVLSAGRLWSRLFRRPLLVPSAWVVAATSAATLTVTGVTGSVSAVFSMPESNARVEVVSRSQIEFFASLPDYVPEGQKVLGDPWDGSAWTLAFGAREPVFPHVNGQWDPARLILAWNLASIETDPAVCAALDELRVRYVVFNPHEFGGGDPAGNHFPGPHAAVEAGLFTEVATDGESKLYRIDQCGALPADALPAP